MSEIKCKVQIDKIFYPKEKLESGNYAIFSAKVLERIDGEEPKVHPLYNTITLKGNVPIIKKGEVFNIIFDEEQETKRGVSYRVINVAKTVDIEDKEDLRSFYEFICGKKIADELMKIENSYELFTHKKDEELLNVKGVGKKRLEKIYEKFDQYSDKSYAFSKLLPLGLTKGLINSICSSVGGSLTAVEMCYKNPYDLIKKVQGISFVVADKIAMKTNYANLDKRIYHAIIFVLERAGESGKSYLTAPQLMQELNSIIKVNFKDADRIVGKLLKDNVIKISKTGKEIALLRYIKLEQALATRFQELSMAESTVHAPMHWKQIIRNIEEKQNWSYTDEQKEAISLILNNNVVAISGKAGCGKTSVINGICEVLNNYSIKMCCLSAKAAQRIAEVTGKEAYTIHRLLGINKSLGKKSDSRKDETVPVDADIIIVDEASMVNGDIFLQLICSIKLGKKLIILGDDGQLTSIGNCSVFSDLINNNTITHIELTKIHRQAQKSAIITKSIQLRNQKNIYENGFYGHRVLGELKDLDLYVEKTSDNFMHLITERFIKDLIEVRDICEIQIITPLKNKGTICTSKINLEIQKLLDVNREKSFIGQGGVEIFLGDKVINLKNNYKCKDEDDNEVAVFNGSIGIVEAIFRDRVLINFIGIGKVFIDKDFYDNINLAYAISCHSSQGSQWKRVICVFEIGSYVLLNVEMLYTSITRAISNCSLIVQDKAMKYAVRNVEQKSKQTFLKAFLEKSAV